MEYTRIWRPGAYGDVVCLLSLLSETRSQLPDELPVLVAPQTFWGLAALSEAMGFGESRVYLAEDSVFDHKALHHDPQTSKLIGYPFDLDGKPKLMEKHLAEYFAEELGILNPDSRDLGGRAKHLTLEPRVLEALETRGPDEYITIQVSAGWSKNKNWKFEYWTPVVEHLHKLGCMVVQLGHRSELEVPGVDVYMPVISQELAQHIGVQSRAVAHIGPDSVFNHTSAIKWGGTHRVPSVIIWGSTNPRGFGYPHNHNIYLDLPCQPCYGVNHCKLEETYPQVCTHAVSPDMVIGAINGMVVHKEPQPMPAQADRNT